jgi:Domain of unknown function (DUF3470)
VQDHRLRRGVPRQLLLRGREHARNPPRRVHRLRGLRARPVDAIKPDTEPGLEKWLELNREFAQKWPNITAKKDMPKDARTYWDETGKFDKYFSAKPGEGD